MKKALRKGAARLLKLFTKIDEIPFTDNGTPKIFATLYVFGLRVTSGVLEPKK